MKALFFINVKWDERTPNLPMKRVFWERLFVAFFKLNGRKLTRFLLCPTLLVYLEQGSPQVKKDFLVSRITAYLKG
jgi:hypothetical protein